MRGLSWHPSGPLIPGDALDAGHANARRLLRPPTLTASHHPACSYPRWLRPWRHATEQNFSQAPDMVRQSRGHRWRLRAPLFGRPHAVRGHGLWQGLAYAGVRQAKVVTPGTRPRVMTKITDPVHFRWRLRLGGARRPEEAAGEGDKEPDATACHGSLLRSWT